MTPRHERIERLMGSLFVGLHVEGRTTPMAREAEMRLEWAYEWAESIVDYVDSRRLPSEGNTDG